jgi:hypothetical protein
MNKVLGQQQDTPRVRRSVDDPHQPVRTTSKPIPPSTHKVIDFNPEDRSGRRLVPHECFSTGRIPSTFNTTEDKRLRALLRPRRSHVEPAVSTILETAGIAIVLKWWHFQAHFACGQYFDFSGSGSQDRTSPSLRTAGCNSAHKLGGCVRYRPDLAH